MSCFLCKKKVDKSISTHRIPLNTYQRERWLSALHLKEKDIYGQVKICGLHFDNECFNFGLKQVTLKYDSLPTKFLSGVPEKEYSSNSTEKLYIDPQEPHIYVEGLKSGEACETSTCESSIAARDVYKVPASKGSTEEEARDPLALTDSIAANYSSISTEETPDPAFSNISGKDREHNYAVIASPPKNICYRLSKENIDNSQYKKRFSLEIPAKLDFSSAESSRRHYQSLKKDNAKLRYKMVLLRQKCKRMEKKINKYKTVIATLKQTNNDDK